MSGLIILYLPHTLHCRPGSAYRDGGRMCLYVHPHKSKSKKENASVVCPTVKNKIKPKYKKRGKFGSCNWGSPGAKPFATRIFTQIYIYIYSTYATTPVRRYLCIYSALYIYTFLLTLCPCLYTLSTCYYWPLHIEDMPIYHPLHVGMYAGRYLPTKGAIVVVECTVHGQKARA